MKVDYLSYQHATHRSILGLAIQFCLGIALLVYSIYARDHAAMTAAFFVLIGTPIWVALAVVFDQHRRERIEAVEAEAFAASDAAASSVFEQQSDDLRVAHKRLKWMYRFLIPGMSLLVAALLIGLGLWRFRSGRVEWDTFESPGLLQARTDHRGWAIAISLGTAFVGFLFARYMSGMAKQKVWVNLRAGAAYAAGTALLGLAIAVGNFIDIPSTDVVLQVLVLAYPILMIAVGAEFVVNFLLDLYRPRKPGEFPKPAFESRALGFLAAPDKIAESIGEAINYQFGYDVTDSWVYRLLARSVFRILIPIALVVLWGMTALAVVRPHERGMVLRFGQLSRIVDPGLHFKWPWPIETVEVPEYTVRDAQGNVKFSGATVTGVRSLDVGSPPPAPDKAILWTNEHAQEVLFLVQPNDVSASAPAEANDTPKQRGRIDLAVLAAEIPVQYVIDNPEAYELLGPPDVSPITNLSMRDSILKAVAQRAVMQRLSTMTVGDLLSVKRTEVMAELRRTIEAAFVQLNPIESERAAGKPVVRVLFVGLDGVHPPKDTARMFELVVGAEQLYNAKKAKARGEEVRTLTASVGSVDLANTIVAEMDKLEDMKRSKTTPEAIKEQELRVVTLIQQAGGKASAMIQDASAERWAKHMGERSRLFQYQGQLGTYRAAPAVYRAGLYLDSMRDALAKSRVFITDGTKLDIRFDFQDRDTASSVLQEQNPINP
jgi:regulator of protease activity HflC (stomatin/prohibitin superfamily)